MNYSLSDLAAVTNGAEGWGGNSLVTLLLLFALISGNGVFGGGRNYVNDYATAASQQEVLFNQHFNNLDNKMDRGFTSIGNGIADATFSLNNSIKDGNYATQTAIKDCCCTTQRNTDALRFDMSNYHADTNAVVTAQTQKILDVLAQNKIDSLQAQVSELKTQNMFCGIPRINPYGYGVYPYANQGCGCNCGNI